MAGAMHPLRRLAVLALAAAVATEANAGPDALSCIAGGGCRPTQGNILMQTRKSIIVRDVAAPAEAGVAVSEKTAGSPAAQELLQQGPRGSAGNSAGKPAESSSSSSASAGGPAAGAAGPDGSAGAEPGPGARTRQAPASAGGEVEAEEEETLAVTEEVEGEYEEYEEVDEEVATSRGVEVKQAAANKEDEGTQESAKVGDEDSEADNADDDGEVDEEGPEAEDETEEEVYNYDYADDEGPDAENDDDEEGGGAKTTCCYSINFNGQDQVRNASALSEKAAARASTMESHKAHMEALALLMNADPFVPVSTLKARDDPGSDAEAMPGACCLKTKPGAMLDDCPLKEGPVLQRWHEGACPTTVQQAARWIQATKSHAPPSPHGLVVALTLLFSATRLMQ